ncbi:hypothetical protein DFQ28_010523 [Apophysomyces sp. BC1034]|nr:hypothetical protein DFQ30_010153 [Apophysomyces sp. BC1015]KAG0171078.1 hypothetical protein DFQ29_008996 [Apophysomyces sp. BC1021]KAG0184774.1 hypothetical protein DFQ28_010523 [Apophysomyces sp. BC1034]
MKSAVFLGLAALCARVAAADIQYSVIAFPQGSQKVGVSVNGQIHPLSSSSEHPNLYKGTGPSGEAYQYVLTGDAGGANIVESTQRKLAAGAALTGNEFFNRTQSVYNVPELPKAFNPIYPPLYSGMSRSNEIATILLDANMTGFNAILTNPKGQHDYTEVYKMTYITNRELYSFDLAGIKNSGQSSKDFAKQSYKIKLSKFSKENKKELLFGRTTLKLRAHETDPTYIREKLMMDCLAASGAATLSGSWVRLIVNNEPFGLYLMIDDATTSFIDNALHAGDYSYKNTGPTYKGNAMTPQDEGNLVYHGDDVSLYPDSQYKLQDKGNLGKEFTAEVEKQPLIEFTRSLSQIDPVRGDLSTLIDPEHLMVHMALNFLSGSWDGFWYQASNYYLNQDLGSKKWTLISYDFDEVFGVGALPGMISTTYTNYSRPDSQRPLIDAILKSETYRPRFETILKTIVKRFFKPAVMVPRIEAWHQMLREDVMWDISIPTKSPGMNSTWTLWNFDHNMKETDGQVTGLAEWIQLRSAALQQQLGFTDEDDLPQLEPYSGGKQWDQNNYEPAPKTTDKKPENAGSISYPNTARIALATVVMTLAHQLLL